VLALDFVAQRHSSALWMTSTPSAEARLHVRLMGFVESAAVHRGLVATQESGALAMVAQPEEMQPKQCVANVVLTHCLLIAVDARAVAVALSFVFARAVGAVDIGTSRPVDAVR
jgi:hypothetical protein